ncbi:MAG TPA: hypothetical protein VIV60_00810 [Polyangiaceae bacterium]
MDFICDAIYFVGVIVSAGALGYADYDNPNPDPLTIVLVSLCWPIFVANFLGTLIGGREQ